MLDRFLNAFSCPFSLVLFIFLSCSSNCLQSRVICDFFTYRHCSDIRKALTHSLSLFIPLISQTALQIATRLGDFQRQHGLYEAGSGKDIDKIMDGVGVAAMQLDGLANLDVLDAPALNSRAGPYILLNALVSGLSTHKPLRSSADTAQLVGRPAVDSSLLLSHLDARYKVGLSRLVVVHL